MLVWYFKYMMQTNTKRIVIPVFYVFYLQDATLYKVVSTLHVKHLEMS